MTIFNQIIYDEIQRAENMLANYVGQAHGTVELDTFSTSAYSNISAEVKRIVLALQILPAPANPSQELAARYMNLTDNLGVAVSKPRMHPALIIAHDAEACLSNSFIVSFLRHAIMVALTFGAIQMPSAAAQLVCFIAMLSAALACGRFTKPAPGKGMAAGYIVCMIGYGVGATVGQDGQAVMAAAGFVWAVTTVVAVVSIIVAFVEANSYEEPKVEPFQNSPVIGSYLNPLTFEYNAVDVGGSIKLL